MKPLEGYERPMPSDPNSELALEFANFRDTELSEEIEREKELRETISEIEKDLERMEKHKDKMDYEGIYKQLKFLNKKEDSFLFRYTAGVLLPDSVEEIAEHSDLSAEKLSETYRTCFSESEKMNEDEVKNYLEKMGKLERSNTIELRSDPTEVGLEAEEEFERILYHLEGVAERARDRYRELSEDIEKSFRDYIRGHDDLSEDDIEWISPTHISY